MTLKPHYYNTFYSKIAVQCVLIQLIKSFPNVLSCEGAFTLDHFSYIYFLIVFLKLLIFCPVSCTDDNFS